LSNLCSAGGAVREVFPTDGAALTGQPFRLNKQSRGGKNHDFPERKIRFLVFVVKNHEKPRFFAILL
jgi:hypothetical protein